MAKLILSMDGLVLKEIPLTKERLTIGRKPHNDIQIDNLAISGEHAVVVSILNDSFLEDLNSTNGTLVNGQPVKKHFLKNGDVVELGKYKLKYVIEPVSLTEASDFEKTTVVRPGSIKLPVSDSLLAMAPGAASDLTQSGPFAAQAAAATVASAPTVSAALAVIQILNGSNAGRELELAKTLTTLGKPGVQVAVIARRPNGYFLTHVEGTQFPVVNGKVLDAQAHPLNDHDVIELAGIKMEFFFKG